MHRYLGGHSDLVRRVSSALKKTAGSYDRDLVDGISSLRRETLVGAGLLNDLQFQSE